MLGRFAVELGRDRLLDQIFPLDDAAQHRLNHLVAALVGRHIGEPHFVVEFLLGHIVRADMSDNLSHNGRRILFLAAAAKNDRRKQSAHRRGETPGPE